MASSSRFNRHAALAYQAHTGQWPAQVDGLRHVWAGRGRSRGLLVSLHDTGSLHDRWATVCELHQTSVTHHTYPKARQFAARPIEWCPGCSDRRGPIDPEPAPV